MKTCVFYDVPQDVAALTIEAMNDKIIKLIKKNDYDKVDELLWCVKAMQNAYARLMEEEDE